MQHQFRSGRILPQVTDCASPRASTILARNPAADWCGECKPSPLWERVLTAARELTDAHTDWELLNRTRLLDVREDLCVVHLAGDPLEAAEHERLCELLNSSLALAGLNGCHVRLTCDQRAWKR